MKMKDDRKRQNATDEVFVSQHSKKGRHYTEHESQIIKNKANE